jgi:hypothetical protein
MGRYWNLVMPYAFASGFFPPNGAAAHGILTYLNNHGSRMLGVARADAHIAYGYYVAGDGLAEVYSLAPARFLADNDQADQLTLSLYGMLAVGMTPDTYISGGAISVLPVRTDYYRTMYMPPNLGRTRASSRRCACCSSTSVAARSVRLGASTWRSRRRALARRRRHDRRAGLPDELRAVVVLDRAHGMSLAVDLHVPRTPTPLRIRFRLPSGVHVGVVHLGRRRLPFDAKTSTLTLRGARGT